MALSGWALNSALILLVPWFVLLFAAFWRLFRVRAASSERGMRGRLTRTIGGIAFAAIAVGSLLLIHLSWASPALSQRLGPGTASALSSLIIWATAFALLLSSGGYGRIRFLGMGTSLIVALWWLGLSTTAAVSMGPATARHPTRFLIPQGFVGWVEVLYGQPDAHPLPLEGNIFVCKIPRSGLLETSSLPAESWANDEYVYDANGTVAVLRDTGWGRGGMIWRSVFDEQGTPAGFEPRRVAAQFYVGSEAQYRTASHNEKDPFKDSGKAPPRR